MTTDLKTVGLKKMASSLIGKVLSKKLVNREVFRSVMRKILQTREWVEIEPIRENVFTIYFQSVETKQNITSGRPWSFDDSLTMMEEPEGKGDIQHMKFNKAELWVVSKSRKNPQFIATCTISTKKWKRRARARTQEHGNDLQRYEASLGKKKAVNGQENHMVGSKKQRFHIDVKVSSGSGNEWWFTGFYDHPETDQQIHGWNLLKRLHDMVQLPWLCVGDFNEVLSSKEKLGGLPCNRRMIEIFCNALDYYGLDDLGFRGPRFTWSNKRDGVFTIEPNKALGLDGLPGMFYKKFWDLVRPSVTAKCLRCMNDGGGSLEVINKMLVVFIPKVMNPGRITEFRPISLCDVIYKIVAKTLAN
ncbi:hypothetical protein Ddye_013272 [Dipteronia dyeriana]|uniref:DUF4283 domain-containing protein n=1 Tax=Dipteronia dyeriana TaxID=168575 RepID=A0AAD9X5T4_9ROSI|nr:hypothetical protein Ddye_013272 [Dipteronia dyeriana]